MAEQDARGRLKIAKERAMKKGEERGEKRGEKRGIKKGVKKGIKKGKIEEKELVIERCLEEDMSINLIAKAVNLSVEEVEEIIHKIKNK